MNTTIYRTVSVRERLPKEENNYDVIFFEGTEHRCVQTVHFDRQYYFHCPDMDCTGITHWLEEIELPNRGKVESEGHKHGEESVGDSFVKFKVDCAFRAGAEWMKDFVLAVTPKEQK